MKLVRFLYQNRARYGALADDHVQLLDGDPFSDFQLSGVSMNKDKVPLLPPAAPSKVVAIGLNYRDHARELGMEVPREPVLFLKPPSALIGPGSVIVCPASSRQIDFEAELAVVIKKTAAHVSEGEAADYILGYTCANDVTARDLQKIDGQWSRAKGFDTFCPLGPHIETDLDPADLKIRLKLNGGIKQDSSTGQMVHNVFQLVSFVSGVMTLLPGDVILTGTPPGVGQIAAGDSVEVVIEGIGRLQNSVI
jgi:2-keto-4-pentenoate hydratase/2-oxohepta-3-ene-1,7-dioic acid hydratase in catechol pathway